MMIDRITALSLETNNDELAALWRIMRNGDGSGVVDAAYLQADTIAAGNGRFWQESTRRAGTLFLYSPLRVLCALEELL